MRFKLLEAADQIKIVTTSTGAYDGQVDMQKVAYINDIAVGHLSYSIYEDVPHIQMIEVNEKYRRQGIATKLIQSLQSDFPNAHIDTGMRTPEGVKFFDAISKDIPNPEYIKLKEQIDKIEYKLIRIENYWKALYKEDSNGDCKAYHLNDDEEKYTIELSNKQNELEHDLFELKMKLNQIPNSILKLNESRDTLINNGININDSVTPWTDLILDGKKTIETRKWIKGTENNPKGSLHPFIGKRVAIIRTGKGKAQIVGYVNIDGYKVYNSKKEFEDDNEKHLVTGTDFYQEDGRKIGYILSHPKRIKPIDAPNGGRVSRRISMKEYLTEVY